MFDCALTAMTIPIVMDNRGSSDIIRQEVISIAREMITGYISLLHSKIKENDTIKVKDYDTRVTVDHGDVATRLRHCVSGYCTGVTPFPDVILRISLLKKL